MTPPPEADNPDVGHGVDDGTASRRSALQPLLAAIPFLLLSIYRYGVAKTALQLAPVLILGGALLLLPPPLRRRPWAVWTFLIGGVGGSVLAGFVLPS